MQNGRKPSAAYISFGVSSGSAGDDYRTSPSGPRVGDAMGDERGGDATVAKVRVCKQVFHLADAVFARPGVEEAYGHVIEVRQPEAHCRRFGLEVSHPLGCQTQVGEPVVFARLFDVVHIQEVGLGIPVVVVEDFADIYSFLGCP